MSAWMSVILDIGGITYMSCECNVTEQIELGELRGNLRQRLTTLKKAENTRNKRRKQAFVANP